MKNVPVHRPSVRSLKTVPRGSSPPGGLKLSAIAAALALAGIGIAPSVAFADVANPVCPKETVFFNPGNGEDIVLPRGFKIEVFPKGLNFPTDIAFLGDKHNFRVFVLESGTGLPGRCNNNENVPGVGKFAANNPFTPDILIF